MISTLISAKAAAALERLMGDQVQVYDVGPTETSGAVVSRLLSASGEPVAALVQPLALPNDAEGRSASPYSVKVARNTGLRAGQAVQVLRCQGNAALEGKYIFIDSVNLGHVRKGTGTVVTYVDHQGKGSIS